MLWANATLRCARSAAILPCSNIRPTISKATLYTPSGRSSCSTMVGSSPPVFIAQLTCLDPYDELRKPDNVVFMDATRLQTATIMQPQYRNRHHFMIFGGFLLKQTFELAFTAAAAFAHARPTFVSLDPSTFQNPVPVGSILYLTATVVYTDPPLIGAPDEKVDERAGYTRVQIRIDSKVRDVEHGHSKPTGQFNYTFTVPKNIRVMPRTYQEFMMYIDARRRAEQVKRTLEEGYGVSPKTAEDSLTE